MMQLQDDPISGGGSGRSLPAPLLWTSTASALFATVFSLYSINQQLRAYRKPVLQRYVVRLLLMVPIYSLASMSSLFSLQAAFVIDVIRDVYEGFVIWSFFSLLVEYLGGERSLLILVHGRQPVQHPFPVNLFFSPLDISDPYTFLGLKRGILQYVQIKPILAVLTVILKSVGKYDDGKLAWSNGYTWISVTYNFSVFLSLYCLGMFWAGLADDLAPFRVTSKFLCIKGIIFFSFWQGFGVSILVATGLVKQIGPVRDEEYISLAIQDMLICLEMPLFALGHAYAFSPRDYIDPFSSYQSRLPAYYALRDAIGMYDVISDSLTTIRGTGYGYQTFEPSEGIMHQQLGRKRRGRAGLRYTQGGKAKYWLPLRATPEMLREAHGVQARHIGPAKQFRRWLDRKRMEREGYAPLLAEEAQDIVHEVDVENDAEAAAAGTNAGESSKAAAHPLAQQREMATGEEEPSTLLGKVKQWTVDHAQASFEFFERIDPEEEMEEGTADLQFSDIEEHDEMEILYSKSRNLAHGDYAFPNVDVREEEARRRRFEEDDNMLRRYRAQKGQRMRVGRILGGRENGEGSNNDSDEGPKAKQDDDTASPTPPGVVDILVEDSQAEERERLRERRRGDPALKAGQRTRIFRRQYHSTADGSTSQSQQTAQRPEMEAEEDPIVPASGVRSKGKGSANDRKDEGVEDRIEADAQRPQHPEAIEGDANDSHAPVSNDDSVEAVESAGDEIISRIIQSPLDSHSPRTSE